MLLSNTSTNGTQIKFNPVTGNDTMVKNGISKDITTKLICLTAMQQYQTKSLEELRVEDYQVNRKFPTAGSTTSVFGSGGTTSGFGTTGTTGGFGTSGSLFGGAQQNTTGTTGSFFGANTQKPSIFGGATASPSTGTNLFGNTSTPTNQQTSSSLFGNNQAARPPGSLFGSSTTVQKPSLFGGTATAPATGGGLFGGGNPVTSQQPTTGGLFGSAQPAAASSFFGSSTASKPSLFGSTPAAQQPSTGLFGSTPAQQQQPSTGIFGGTTATQPTTGLFGSAQPAASTSGSLFGNAPKPSLFGNAPAASVGGSLFGGGTAITSQPATGLFGSNQPAAATTGSLFGNAPKPSLFGGATSTAPTLGGGGFFGGSTAAAQPAAGGLFGGASTFGQPAAAQIQQPQSAIAQPPIFIGGESSEASIRQAIIESQLSMYPYGDSQILRSFSLKSNEETAKEAVKLQMEKERLNENYFSSRLGKQDTSLKESDSVSKRYQQSSVLSAGRPSVFNYKPLVQRNGFAATELNVSAEISQTVVVEQHSSSVNDSFKIPRSNLFVPSLSSLSSKKSDNPKHLDLSVLSDAVQENVRSARLSSISHSEVDVHTSSPLPAAANIEPPRSLNFDLTASPQPRTTSNRSENSRLNGSLNESSQQVTLFGNNVTQESAHDTTLVHGPVGVVLSKRDVYTEPPIEELENFVKDGKVHLVDGFVVGRLGYGRIEWPGAIAFSDVDLSDLVRFQRKQVCVYPDETKKPPIGEGFNRRAIVSLENVYPINKETKEEIRDPLSEEAREFTKVLERKCIKMDCDFLEYDAENGVWAFRVKHFSKYGL